MRSIRTLDVSRRAPSEREPLEITHHVGLVRLIPDGGGQLEIGYGSLCVGDRVSKDDRVSFWNRTAAELVRRIETRRTTDFRRGVRISSAS